MVKEERVLTKELMGEKIEGEQVEEATLGAMTGKVQHGHNWADMVSGKGNRYSSMGIKLFYVKPINGIVEFTQDEWENGIDEWKCALIGYVMGSKPAFKDMVRFTNVAWKEFEIPMIHQLNTLVFLFKFALEEAKDAALNRHWTYFLAPLVL
ncbi:hypothetical protein SLA2020_156110 [Shorea laevis]